MSVDYLFSIIEKTDKTPEPRIGWGVRFLIDEHAKSVIHELYKRFYLVTKDNFVFEFRDMSTGIIETYITKFPTEELIMFPEYPL